MDSKVADEAANKPARHQQSDHDGFGEVQLHILTGDGRVAAGTPWRLLVPPVDEVSRRVELGLARAADVLDRQQSPAGGDEALAVHWAHCG